MQIKSLVASLVLATSSIAAAAPTVRDHRTVVATPDTSRANGGVIITPAPIAAPIVAPVPARSVEVLTHAELRIGKEKMRPLPPVYRPAPAPTWLTLADNAALKGRTTIDLRNIKRAFSKVELRAEGNGRVAIDKVMIEFGNGQRQVVNLDAKLTKKSPTHTIDLKGDTRVIEKIVIVGKTSGKAASLDVRAL